ncbi:hypothetical protein ILYODFUR_015669, partial [Ilyodon furcidens]
TEAAERSVKIQSEQFKFSFCWHQKVFQTPAPPIYRSILYTHVHRENMQTPCRKTPGRELSPGPSCYQYGYQLRHRAAHPSSSC